MNIIEAIRRWWNRKSEWARNPDGMTTDELKTEYQTLYRKRAMGVDITHTEYFRMNILQMTLHERRIYINNSGVDCYFQAYE